MPSNDRSEPVLASAHDEPLPADDETPTLEIPAVSLAGAGRALGRSGGTGLEVAEGARVTLVAGLPADDS